MNETIRWASGHECRDNSVGDFDLWCPTHPTVFCFIPYMTALCMPPEKVCPFCLLPIGEVVELGTRQ